MGGVIFPWVSLLYILSNLFPNAFYFKFVPRNIVLNVIFLLLEASAQVEVEFLIELISFEQCKNNVLVKQFLKSVRGFYVNNRNACE